MFFFRADSNSIISGGHIMRCLAIANELIESGGQVCFLISDDNPVPVLKSAGVSYFNLNSDWQDLMTDVDEVQRILEKDDNPTLLIDTYRINREYVEHLKPCCRIGYLGSKPEYLGNLDLLINYSADIDYQFYRKNYGINTQMLLGVSYAPLRKEFQNVVHEYRNHITRILLTTGNTDKDGIVQDILNSLLLIIDEHHITIDVIVGRMFEGKGQLHKAYGSKSNISLRENVESMSSLMKECDLAISANGTTVYELSAMGLPIISFAMVDEQVKNAEALERLGVIDYCGRSYQNKLKCISTIKDRVLYYIYHNDALVNLAYKAHRLIDGNGCRKIVGALML